MADALKAGLRACCSSWLRCRARGLCVLAPLTSRLSRGSPHSSQLALIKARRQRPAPDSCAAHDKHIALQYV
eukprot:365898-Chlamydomonas_euryale.AAC.8